LPPNTDCDFFVIQVPKAPFGLALYQGDIETNKKGVGHGTFIVMRLPEVTWTRGEDSRCACDELAVRVS